MQLFHCDLGRAWARSLGFHAPAAGIGAGSTGTAQSSPGVLLSGSAAVPEHDDQAAGLFHRFGGRIQGGLV